MGIELQGGIQPLRGLKAMQTLHSAGTRLNISPNTLMTMIMVVKN